MSDNRETIMAIGEAFRELADRLEKSADRSSSDYDERIINKVAREVKRIGVGYCAKARR